MKIWLEALTGKQAMLFHHLALKLEGMGHETFFTSRPYAIDRSNGNLDRLGRDHHSIGEHGASLLDKLVKGSERIVELAKLVAEYNPDLLIAFPSPQAFRTAFGLGIKSIQINDTPHATAVAKLTISTANAVVHAEAIKSEEFSIHGVSNFIPYSGVDEVEWIKNFIPNEQVLHELGVVKNKYIVVRCEESKAAYFNRMYPSIKPGSTIVVDIIRKIKENNIDLDIVAFPRYPEQEDELKELNVIVPISSVDGQSLLTFARATMTAGGTMGRESAMLGTPTLYSFPLELAVSKYISDKGFPLIHEPNHLKVVDKIIELIQMPRIDENIRLKTLSEMESPFEGVLRAFKLLGLDDN